MRMELVTPAEMKHVEALAPAHGVSLRMLMENAGRAVAAEIIARYPQRPVTVLCGPGNNGGDGFVIARLLNDLGWPVTLHLLGERAKLKGDALAMSKLWSHPIKSMDDDFAGALIVDAIFGIGLKRDFPEALANRINSFGTDVVSVDIPSGVDALSGAIKGAAVKADLTVTFYRQKPGHVIWPGRAHCGEIVTSEIGLPESATSQIASKLWINAPPLLPLPERDAHKYSRGGAVIWSGDALHSGASRLAAWAAQGAGAGIVCLAGPRDGLMVHAHHVSSILLHEIKETSDIENLLGGKKYSACCFGPASGTTDAHRRIAMGMIASGKKIVLDADAFTLFAGNRDMAFRMMKQFDDTRAVLTPHSGEFERLFPDLAEGYTAAIDRARAAAEMTGAVVVLKGPSTIIAAPSGETALQAEAPSKLATAGSGDVLAGLITGLMAQGVSPFEAAQSAVWLHADAARKIPHQAMTAEELVQAITQ
jgi:ADP-dependent NAD(P)H-hydrate dehydratase / NAD(P)H-hydrate epimerase